jgi:hypothetical protein
MALKKSKETNEFFITYSNLFGFPNVNRPSFFIKKSGYTVMVGHIIIIFMLCPKKVPRKYEILNHVSFFFMIIFPENTLDFQ